MNQIDRQRMVHRTAGRMAFTNKGHKLFLDERKAEVNDREAAIVSSMYKPRK